mmetsp:Transcript_32683/g.76627  ORF Transcript_32683/g.76627 Transcript_32683/m.76627 type:complete len:914 (+) Transcript_32683:146-2887(+)
MDEQLIKPQKVRRVVRIRPGSPTDVVAHNTLVEVSDPSTLRPHEFRADFVFNPTETVQDIAQEELTPLIGNVLNGFDSTVLLTGPEDAGQGELLDENSGLGVLAVDRLLATLLQREAAQRQQGGSYRFSMKLQYFMLHGDRIQDLLPDKPEPAMLQDTVDGVAVVGVRSLAVTGTREVMEALDAANRRRLAAGYPRGHTGAVFCLEVTQADYRTLTGILGRLMLVETPSLDCLAQDRNLVQVHEGFDTFRGVFHLRAIASDWNPRHAADVKATALTWLLRDALTGGSTALTVLVSLRQGQPLKSRVILEFVKELSKVETNPVPWDNRVAGFARALRAEALQASSLQDAHRRADGRHRDEEDMRRQIIELQRLLQEAQRGLAQSGNSDQTSRRRAEELAHAYKSEAEMHEQLILATEERNQEYKKALEEEQHKVTLRQEMNERKYQDADTMLALFTEVEEMEARMKEESHVREELGVALKESAGAEAALAQAETWHHTEQQQAQLLDDAQKQARELKQKLDAATEDAANKDIAHQVDRDKLENRIGAIRLEMERGGLDSEARAELQSEKERAGKVATDRQHLEQEVKRLQDQLQVMTNAEKKAREAQQALEEELAKARHGLQATAVPPADPAAAASASGEQSELPARTLSDVAKKASDREQALSQECRDLRVQVRELQEQLVNTTHQALSWAPESVPAEEKLKLQQGVQDAERKAVDAARVDAERERALRERDAALAQGQQEVKAKVALARKELEAEFGKERQQHRQERERFLKELEARDVNLARKDAELLQLRQSPQPVSTEGGSRQRPRFAAAAAEGEGAVAELQERNRALQEQLAVLQTQAPSEQRKQLQRLKWLETQVHDLETERTTLMVRATVAEEMVQQHDQTVQQLAQKYERDLAQVRRELAAATRR